MSTTSSPSFRPAGSGKAQNVLGMSHTYKASVEDTNGAFTMFEVTVPPGSGAPMHRHHVDAECFYVLEGSLTFFAPGTQHVAKAGDVCFLPAGGAHAFLNQGTSQARAIVIATPGRDAESFFGEIDAAMRFGPPDLASVTAIAARHQITILPQASAP
jgi:quercetin dioxygenase-like cupin family protein